MKWIPLTERKPTREDGDERGIVLLRSHEGVIATTFWDSVWIKEYAHFARLRDIELPPPPPEMPERLEFVRTQPGEGCDGNGFWFNPKTSGVCTVSYLPATSGYALYRRVEPGKRIVFEVGEKRPPKTGEWFLLGIFGGREPSLAQVDMNSAKTILRLVEGEEYLKC